MTTRRYYANAAPQQTLTGPITNSGTSLSVSGSFAGWPSSYPFFACLEYGTASMEIVSVTNIVGTTATIVRAQDGTAGISHLGGATFDQVAVRQDFDEASAHTSANFGVHGVSGNVVGISDTQTLTNKTLTSPVISNPSVSGTATVATVTASGLVTANAGLTVVGGETVDSVTASKYIRFPSYTNEAAATAAGANLTGAQVYLSAPTTGAPGVYTFYNSQWNFPIEDSQWQTYTPTWTGATTNPTLGNGTLNGKWIQLGYKTIGIKIQLTTGSTTTFGSGAYFFALPSAAASDFDQMVSSKVAVTGANYLAFGFIPVSSTTVECFAVLVNGNAGSSAVGSTNFSGTGAKINFWGIYETT